LPEPGIAFAIPGFNLQRGRIYRRERKEHKESKRQLLDCGGKRSATPLFELCRRTKCAIAAALCYRTPKSQAIALPLCSLRSLRLKFKSFVRMTQAAGCAANPLENYRAFFAECFYKSA
jgi:hypothetical protein